MSNVVLKNSNKFEQVYLMGGDAVMYYPRVNKPFPKHKSDEKQYSVTVFVDTETRNKLEMPVEEDGVFINKQFYEVGVDRNKKKKVKFPTSDQVGEDERHYDDVKGLHGFSLTCPEFKKNGDKVVLNVVDADGNPLQVNIGTGSKGNFRMWGWRNEEGQLNVTLDTVQVTELVEAPSGGAGGYDDIMGIDLSKNQPTMKNKPEPDFDDDGNDDIPF